MYWKKQTSELKHLGSACRTEVLIWPTSLQNTRRFVLLPQTEQLGNCTSRSRDLSQARHKRQIIFQNKTKKKKQKIHIRRTAHKETVEMRISSERQQHYDTVVWFFFSVFTCSMACPPARAVLSGRVWGGDPASESSWMKISVVT